MTLRYESQKDKARRQTAWAWFRDMNSYIHIDTMYVVVIAGGIIATSCDGLKHYQPQDEVLLAANIRGVIDQVRRDLSCAMTGESDGGSNHPYFEIRQLGSEQSVLRFGSHTGCGAAEIAYQVRTSNESWTKFDIHRMCRTQMMWRCDVETNWPQITFGSRDVSPWVPNIIAFKVLCRTLQTDEWIACNWDSRSSSGVPHSILIVVKGITFKQAKSSDSKGIGRIRDIPDVRKATEIIVLQNTNE